MLAGKGRLSLIDIILTQISECDFSGTGLLAEGK
jgi:hypothetical protein